MSGGTSITLSGLPAPVVAGSGSHTPRTTAYDVLERLLDYIGGDPGESAFRNCRRAVLDGYREFATAHRWTYLTTAGRLAVNGNFTTGTVGFALSGGSSCERQLTLSGGTWPSWAGTAYVRINNVVNRVQARVSGSVLQLAADTCPVADVAAGTSYTLFQDTYVLPADYVSNTNAVAETIFGGMQYVPPQQVHALERFCESYGTPQWYSILGDPWHPGRLAMRLYPSPDQAMTVDFVYLRTPRSISCFDFSTGAASISLSSPTTLTLTGAGTLTQSHVGSVIRLSATSTDLPTGLEGLNPYAFEATITAVGNATTATLDQAVTSAFSGVLYRLSDPIDVEETAMLTAYFRCAEKNLAIERSQKKESMVSADYRMALILAKEADARVSQQRSASVGGGYQPRLAFMPRGGDIS